MSQLINHLSIYEHKTLISNALYIYLPYMLMMTLTAAAMYFSLHNCKAPFPMQYLLIPVAPFTNMV